MPSCFTLLRSASLSFASFPFVSLVVLRACVCVPRVPCCCLTLLPLCSFLCVYMSSVCVLLSFRSVVLFRTRVCVSRVPHCCFCFPSVLFPVCSVCAFSLGVVLSYPSIWLLTLYRSSLRLFNRFPSIVSSLTI